jgi:serine/threonine protein kinase
MQGSSAPGVSRHAGVLGIGEEISHRYRVERFIARGGMGEVYAVFDTTLDERVALKTVRRRLKTEVALSRRIGHPNTCRIYEFGEHQTEGGEVIHYFTMGLVEGETLGAKVRRDGPLSSQQTSVVARQVLAGLAEAHGTAWESCIVISRATTSCCARLPAWG